MDGQPVSIGQPRLLWDIQSTTSCTVAIACLNCAAHTTVRMMTLINSLGPQFQDFWQPTSLTVSQAQDLIATAVINAKLPNDKMKELPLAGLFTVSPLEQEGRPGLVFSPNRDRFRAVATSWCQSLAALPPKSLPRSQRPMIGILKRLTPEPTGNVAVDRGREMLLDGVIAKSLWASLSSSLVHLLKQKEAAL